MCYFDQTRWSCGYWRWGHFRQQCNKEYRMGETCGLKLVYETRVEADVCKLCHDTEKKQRRYDKMYRDVQRWQREGNRSATIERTCGYNRSDSDKTRGRRERLAALATLDDKKTTMKTTTLTTTTTTVTIDCPT
ncbi:FAD binding domain-containing protein [Purpureocillium lavendulum]|uniref:FAD binding domain-containing protein n=1 Tax=Purpureocillium lavendulum TaxID=1247861 RepID=A0AB34FHE4_9HYPO|nr:FAD binding domain-containing protein [Purpureocillium lavendulum]